MTFNKYFHDFNNWFQWFVLVFGIFLVIKTPWIRWQSKTKNNFFFHCKWFFAGSPISQLQKKTVFFLWLAKLINSMRTLKWVSYSLRSSWKCYFWNFHNARAYTINSEQSFSANKTKNSLFDHIIYDILPKIAFNRFNCDCESNKNFTIEWKDRKKTQN